MFQNLKRVVYQVPDLEEAKDWYMKFLNQEPVFDSPLGAIFRIGDCTMSLTKAPAIPAEDVGRPAVYWEVGDVDKCFARLMEMGATQRAVPKDTLTIRTAQVIDPFGNVLGITGGIQGDSTRTVENQPSETAHGVALCRALASRDKRFSGRTLDPYSELFLKEEVRPVLANDTVRQSVINTRITRPLYGYFIARCAFFDAAFVRALHAGTPQIVFLGAGYDTRALRFRNAIGATRIFEVDALSTQNRKREILRSSNTAIPPQVVFVGMNFKTDDLIEKLNDAGFDRSAATLFIWEGVTYYLSQETIDRTLELLRDISAPGSALCFDYATRKLDSINAGEPFLSWMDPDKLRNYLDQYGYRLIDNLDAAEMSARYLVLEDGTQAEKPLSMIQLAYAER
jgi:methyltransferase (TIGR00027 family)